MMGFGRKNAEIEGVSSPRISPLQGNDCGFTKHKRWKRFSSFLFWVLLLNAIVIFQVYFAYLDNILTLNQLINNGGVGLPLIWHLGMWSDFFLLSPLVAYLATDMTIKIRSSAISIILSLAITILMTLIYLQSDIKEAHVRNHSLTTSGAMHFIYMIICIYVIIMTIFFEGISKIRLNIVGSVVIFHVILANHFVLGVVKRGYGLSWYPDQPLESVVGWLSIIGVALVFGIRKYGIGRIFWSIGFNPKVRSDEDYLIMLDKFCQIANLGLLASVASSYYKGEGIIVIMTDVLIVIMYNLSRICAKNELAIGRLLYPLGRMPNNLGKIRRVLIFSQTVMFVAIYFVLTRVAGCVLVLTFLMLIMSIMDFVTRIQINIQTKTNFANINYCPEKEDKQFDKIMKFREAASEYLFTYPHLKKESFRIIGVFISFIIANASIYADKNKFIAEEYLIQLYDCAMCGGLANFNALSYLSYISLLVVLVINEYITMKWRLARDEKFDRA